jgi:arabinoxylan arabinofuranohydrolase
MKNNKHYGIMLLMVLVFGLALAACANDDDNNGNGSKEDPELKALFDTTKGFPADLSNSWKIWGYHNALITQGFGADPTVMVYQDRAYVFSSNDSMMYDPDTGLAIQMTYAGGIQGLRALSSADLVNWTDHGVINIHGPDSTNPLIPISDPIGGRGPDAKNPGNPQITGSWAPSAVWKEIDGKPQFFVYYANGGNGIGVISADSPTGPWRAPLGERTLLIDRDTPNCESVNYLFDPGAMVDDDGQGYLFFGGGSGGDGNNTGQARRVKLGADMISIIGEPETWNVPYLFEDSEIAKFNGKYYYSYVTNSSAANGLENTQIAYMTSDDPMGEYSAPTGIMLRPSQQLSTSDENNHHCLFQFKDRIYIAYHASIVIRAMGINMRYRSTLIDAVTMNSSGEISPITMTRRGVRQAVLLDPLVLNEAETIGIMGGVYTRAEEGAGNGMVVTSIDTGDWVALYGVDFGSTSVKKFSARVRMPETPEDYIGAIEIRLDPQGGITGNNEILSATNTAWIKGGEVVGRVKLQAKAGEAGGYITVTTNLHKTITGTHNLVFVFYSSLGVHPETVNPDSRHKNGFEFDQWQFFK